MATPAEWAEAQGFMSGLQPHRTAEPYPTTYPGYYTSIDEARRRYQMESDREYDLKAKGIKQQAEQIAISRGQAEATAWYNRQMVQLSKEKFAEEQRQFNVTATGYIDGKPTMAREQFQDTSLFNWTGKAIDLASTPKDWVKLARMNAGMQARGGLDWQGGGQQGVAAFSGQPETNSLGNVMGNLGVGGNWAAQAADGIANSNPQMSPEQQQLYATGRDFGMNSHQAAPGWWESQDPLNKQLIQGAAEAQGLDWATTMAKWNRSRWGGGAGSSTAA